MSLELFVCPHCSNAEMVETSFVSYKCSKCHRNIFIPIARHLAGNDMRNPGSSPDGFGFNDGGNNDGCGFNNGNHHGGFGFNNGNNNNGFGF